MMRATRGLAVALIVSLFAHAVFFLLWVFGYVNVKPVAVSEIHRLTVSLSREPSRLEHGAVADEQSEATTKVPLGTKGANDYATADTLSEQPVLLDDLPEVEFSGSAVGRSDKYVVLRLIIGADGRAKHLQVLDSSVPRYVEEQVVRSVFQASYRPGMIKGKPVAAEFVISVKVE